MIEPGDAGVGDEPDRTRQAPSRDGRVAELTALAAASEIPTAALCRDLAVAHERAGDPAGAVRWALALTDTDGDLAAWSAAAGVLRRCLPAAAPLPRAARVAVLGSYTTSQFAALLPLAAARAGVAVEIYECGYGQYRQEILDPGSGLTASCRTWSCSPCTPAGRPCQRLRMSRPSPTSRTSRSPPRCAAGRRCGR